MSLPFSRHPAPRSRVTGGVWARALAVGSILAFGVPARTASAQLGPNAGAGPSYGYQPYDDHNPTGFYHPNGMGYGHYYLTQKYHTPRFRAFRYRNFRGS